ncbi:MAG: hypothetical protein H0X72_05790 [Acidobacteria bacterium]|jgi:uncharacterized membrane protein|nr:hypothetical protein [Acidobacteriota bacterium]
MSQNETPILFAHNPLGISYSDFLFAYRKEASRIVKLAKGDSALFFKHALAVLEQKKVITGPEAKTLEDCIARTMYARTGKAKVPSTLIALQNTHAKALIDGNSNSFYLNYINLCVGLVREVEGKELPKNPTTPQNSSRTFTFPAGSGGAILYGAIAGAAIGESLGGPAGAVIGGIAGGLVGASSDVDVTTPT